ncbi:MAG TPA: acyl-CoA dehydrogenase, partial [Micromonosporaceae bacterium]|nr:acyl-CoA dehydrogenase [Micromonosporaceae bacterium]
WLLLRRAQVALEALGSESKDSAFYAGVVASARFFSREVLPRLSSDRRIIELASLDAMDVPEEAF